jgi:hypothetical protein
MKLSGTLRLIFATLCINRCRSNNLQAFANAFINCTVDFIQESDNFRFEETYINPFVSNYSPLVIDTLHKSRRLNRDRILNTSIPLERTVSGLYRKFGLCTLFLVNIDFILEYTGNNVLFKQNGISNVLEIIVLSKEDPQFLSFVQIKTPPLTSFTPMTPFGPISIAQTFRSISFTSILIFIRTDMEVFLMCMSCTSSVSHQLISLDYGQSSANVNNPLKLRKMWNHLHRNLAQAPVYVPGFGEPILQFFCKKPFNLQTPENVCSALAIGSVYNFTTGVTSHQRKGYPMAQFAQGSPAGTKFVENFFFRRPSFQRIIWIPFACSYNPYVFVTFFSYDHMSVEILLKPLDVWTWLSYCSFLILTVLSLGTLKRNSQNSLSKRLRDAFMWTVSVMLEQSEEANTSRGKTPDYGYGVILASVVSIGCILISFSIGLAYKSALFSCLTAKLPPPVPKNTRELVASGITYGTTTRHFYNGKPYSTLKEIVLPDQFDQLDPSKNVFHHRFERKLVFFNGSDIDLVLKIANGSPIYFDSELKKVPQTFALLSTEKDVRSFVRLMSRYSYHKNIMNKEPSPFMTRYPWYGVQNFFSENFISALARLHESGIYDRWKANYEIYLQIQMLRKPEIRNKTENVGKEGVHFLMMQSKNGQGRDSSDASNTEQPISLGSVIVVFTSCGAILIAAVFVMFIEKGFTCLCLKNNSNQVVYF